MVLVAETQVTDSFRPRWPGTARGAFDYRGFNGCAPNTGGLDYV